METKLFRKEALAEFFNPDARGTLLTIAPPWSLAVFGVMALLCVALALLASFGRVHLYAEGRGVVRPSEPPIALHAPFAGTVLAVDKAAGSRGRAGEVLVELDARADSEALAKSSRELETEKGDLAALEARLRDWNDAAGHDHDAALALVLIAQIRAQRDKVNAVAQRVDTLENSVERSRIVLPVDATVDDVAVGAGSQVHEGEVVATLVPADARLIGYLSLPERYRSELAAGKAVRLKFDALPYDDVGVGTGRVTRVLDELPSGIKTDAPDSSGVCAEIDVLAMPGNAAAPRKGMTFTGEVLSREARVSAVLFGSPDTGE
jgi:multidrug efflux pump subunit AcrA (membrane-fusion protein)